MITVLRVLFSVILIVMVAVTAWATKKMSIFDGGPPLLKNPWGVATLADAYLGFITFYAWVAYKERSMVARVVWFVLIMTLGNIAMAFYVLLQLFRIPKDGTVEQLLLRKAEK